MGVTFHFDTLAEAVDYVERLGREKVALANRAEEEYNAGRRDTTKVRILSDLAEGRGMIAAAEMIREAKIGEQSS